MKLSYYLCVGLSRASAHPEQKGAALAGKGEACLIPRNARTWPVLALLRKKRSSAATTVRASEAKRKFSACVVTLIAAQR
jgi:hypothetical protein